MSSVQGVVFATAMAAVSGTAVVFLALKLHKPLHTPQPPRSCISSSREKKEEKKNKKKKRVRFAKDVVEPSGNGEDFRKKLHAQIQRKIAAAAKPARGGIPANRMALYNGILRDRPVHRLAYSY